MDMYEFLEGEKTTMISGQKTDFKLKIDSFCCCWRKPQNLCIVLCVCCVFFARSRKRAQYPSSALIAFDFYSLII